MADNDPDIQQIERYAKAMHGVQTGIAMELGRELLLSGQEPVLKHIRVGVDSAHVSDLALTELLIEKGLISRSEFLTKLADCAERERAEREARLSAMLGTKVTLG